MEKPLLINEQEFQEKLLQLVNEYIPIVPARYLRFDIEDVYRQLEKLEEQQIKEVRSGYEKTLEESEVNENG